MHATPVVHDPAETASTISLKRRPRRAEIRVQVVSGDTALVPDEGVTAGSFSMPLCGAAVQAAAAEVRALLVSLAAEKLGQPLSQLRVVDGWVQSTSGAQVAYWDLVLAKP